MPKNSLTEKQWQFWIDRGGTFTDIIAKDPDGILHTKKLLSENPDVYQDAALNGIRNFLGLEAGDPILPKQLTCIRMGTTVATNALLEKKGEPTALAISEGLRDIIEIGYQARPKTFALNIRKPDLLYETVVEVKERVQANGDVFEPLNRDHARRLLVELYDAGFRSIAIVLMHAYKYPDHEKQLVEMAQDIGFTQISASHDVSPLTKIISRGETTIVDAYLTPILRRYINRITAAIRDDETVGKLLFMQSSGGLADAHKFRGRDSILSGPAGGVVGAVHTAGIAGFKKIIGFDMGGTSTDVTHYTGDFEKVYETEVAGVRMRVPMMHIHTVAAGGGSLLRFDGDRFRVGPQSAGADPGPVCYRRGGKLTVTDINLCLGKIQPDFFPAIFGPNQDKPLDKNASVSAFQAITEEIGGGRTLEQVAEGFLDVAIEHMAQAIKKISIARGYDVKDYVLNCFGGAGGQHACLVAQRLGIKTVFLHRYSSVLSAYGMGLADIRTERQVVLGQILDEVLPQDRDRHVVNLYEVNRKDLEQQGIAATNITNVASALLRYKGTDTTIRVALSNSETMRWEFEKSHRQHYGFTAPEKKIILDTLIVESFSGHGDHGEQILEKHTAKPPPVQTVRRIYSRGTWLEAPIYDIEDLRHGHTLSGPSIITEPNGTIVIEKGWSGRMNEHGNLILEHLDETDQKLDVSTDYDPVTLEIFHNLFMSIAQQMGLILQNTSQSVNVKERLDFSCAIFDCDGDLVANAPHVPVHLGSMDSTIKVLIKSGQAIKPGDVFVHNNPYNGGSHLPDITVTTPVFDHSQTEILFYVASRAHHEDIGGISPGSMSPKGRSIREEGVMFDHVKLVDQGRFLSEDIEQLLGAGPYPARNINQNIADLMAQVAANATGVNELEKLVATYGLKTVHAYMKYIQDNAEAAVRKVITRIDNGSFICRLDSGNVVRVRITADQSRKEAIIDFTGTSPQQDNNFNAPGAITRAAVLYVFRCLIDDDIPLNAGCLKPLKIIVPEGSMLNPTYPAAVVAGNVETSQIVTNALFGALEALGSSQGTMNNLTFGNDKYQYYETICSGSPAGPGFDGVPAVHTHMTNTRMTDPEIMEQRYPVLLERFSIERGSGGRGTWCAGDGIIRRIRFLEEMECAILSGYRLVAPDGTKGGAAGRIGSNRIERKNGREEDLGGCAQTRVYPGDAITIRTPTGGGYGSKNRSS